MRAGQCAALLLGLLLPALAAAHPLAPALLQLQESAPGHYDVLWRTSVTRAQRLDVAPELPSDCLASGEPQIATEGGDAVVARWQVQCASALTGRRIAVQGLAQSGINVIVHIRSASGVIDALLGPDQTEFVVPEPAAQSPVFGSYLRLGVEHLLGGFDHLLFVAGLLLLDLFPKILSASPVSQTARMPLWGVPTGGRRRIKLSGPGLVRRWRPLLLTITAFTLGHSLTLALASLGLIKVPQAWAELGIALSILLLAVEIARPASVAPSLLRRWPWLMAAGFGLLHGLGFAGVLGETGLPQGAIVQALLAFNLGIELGQLLWVLALLGLAWAGLKLLRNPSETTARVLPAYLIGSLAAYWCWDRLAALWA